MKPYPFRVPADVTCNVVGEVYEAAIDELSEDMLDVELCNGMLVCAGWYKTGPNTGTYRVSMIGTDGRCLQSIDAGNALEANALAFELVSLYGRIGPLAYSDSGTSSHSVCVPS